MTEVLVDVGTNFVSSKEWPLPPAGPLANGALHAFRVLGGRIDMLAKRIGDAHPRGSARGLLRQLGALPKALMKDVKIKTPSM